MSETTDIRNTEEAELDADFMENIDETGRFDEIIADDSKREKMAEMLKIRIATAANAVDADEAFAGFRRRHRSMRPLLRRIAVAAAACLLALVAVQLWKNHASPATENNITAKANQAGDTAADGSRYLLHAQLEDTVISITSGEHAVSLENLKESPLAGVSVNDNSQIVFTPNLDDYIVTSHTVNIPQGQAASIVLPDGSRVWLNAGSRIVFPSAFKANSARFVKLEGEAYFEVTHNPAWPFVVECNDLRATVLGTSFNLKAYPGEETILTLSTGKVQVEAGKKRMTLAPNQSARIAQGQIHLEQTDAETAICWKEGILFFDGQTLRQIMTQLGRTYNLDVVFRNEKNLDNRIHFRASRDWTIREIIDQMGLVSDTHIEVRNNTIVID
ncbi:MAG: FecR domain-containing protein [Prevotella sp.]|nr:FecR domain-containing protein [Prevotella sp.]MBR1462518.1 FecR domain-containing protein [Prevotella sp.]